jgi:hypothetical protein
MFTSEYVNVVSYCAHGVSLYFLVGKVEGPTVCLPLERFTGEIFLYDFAQSAEFLGGLKFLTACAVLLIFL